MPPRYAYWTILVDSQPTAFRAASQEDLMPTFKRLKEKHASATMMWFQNGKLWTSRLEAQEAMRARGERGRAGDFRQGGGFRDRKRSFDQRDAAPRSDRKLEWRPKSDAPQRDWRPKHEGGKLEWRPKGSASEGHQPRHRAKREAGIPKEEFKKSHGIEARKDKNWRPGGEHKDPRQKYKDAKKAKWSRFKKAIRRRWEGKQGKKDKE